MKEKWNLYNKNGKKLKRECYRGEKLKNNEYHKVVGVWIKNKDNKLLISQRVKEKKHPLMWETTGGSVQYNESEFDAAIREAKEELNIDLTNKKYTLVGKQNRYFTNCNDIYYVYLFEVEEFNDIIVQKEEVNDYKWATIEEIKNIQDEDKFITTPYYEEILYKISLMK